MTETRSPASSRHAPQIVALPQPPRGLRAQVPHPIAALTASTARATDSGGAPTAADDAPDLQTAAFPDLPEGITPLLFTAEQAGVLLAVRASWLRRAAAEGAIASTYLGKHQRFSHADLRAIIAAGARGYRPDHDGNPPTHGIEEPSAPGIDLINS